MATYTELRDLYNDDSLRNRLDVAVTIAAHDLLIAASPTLPEQQWAAATLANPRGEADKALRFLLAANQAATVAQIQGGSDSTLQAQVNSIVSSLVAARG